MTPREDRPEDRRVKKTVRTTVGPVVPSKHPLWFGLHNVVYYSKMLRSSVIRQQQRRAVLVHGVRTPFVKSFGDLMKVDTIGLSVSAVAGLLQRTKLDPEQIDNIVWGNVVMQTNAPNCAREIVIDLNLPKHIVGHSVSMACASGLQSIVQAINMIETGNADVVIAGGSDSVSNGELPLPRKLAHGLAQFVYGKQKGAAAIPNFFKEAGYNPAGWAPQMPAIAERSTGKTMGWHGDMIAEMNQIPRSEQEALAIKSHENACAARKKGYFKEEVVPVVAKVGNKTIEVDKDNLIREDWDKMAEKLGKMKPAFRKPNGTITAGTSSALTDGASCVLVMSEERAKALGYPTDVRMKAHYFSAIDPYPQLLLAPVLGWPKVLEKAGLKAEDIDLYEIHEAFAGQVLSSIKCLESPEFAKKYLKTDKPVLSKPLDRSKLNVNGSSLAVGHPFAATGGRIVTSAMNELRRSQKNTALISICAAGGLGGVAIIERVPQQGSRPGQTPSAPASSTPKTETTKTEGKPAAPAAASGATPATPAASKSAAPSSAAATKKTTPLDATQAATATGAKATGASQTGAKSP
jgi:acetyl-CoA acyltransferase